MIPTGARVLDVGCGTGSISRLIMEARGCPLVGLEPHKQRAETAAARGVPVAGTELTTDILDRVGLFEIVLFADVLEHLRDITDRKSGFASRGSIVASLPNVAHWSVRLNLLRGRFDYKPTGLMDATHLRWFTMASLDRLFTLSGYRLMESQASTGLWMDEYRHRPWRWLPTSLRNTFVTSAARQWPSLFGCQLVIRAEV